MPASAASCGSSVAASLLAFIWLSLRTLTPLQEVQVVNMWLPQFMDWFAAGMLFALVHNRLRLPDPPRWMQRFNTLADDVGTLSGPDRGFLPAGRHTHRRAYVR